MIHVVIGSIGLAIFILAGIEIIITIYDAFYRETEKP